MPGDFVAAIGDLKEARVNQIPLARPNGEKTAVVCGAETGQGSPMETKHLPLLTWSIPCFDSARRIPGRRLGVTTG